MSLPPLDLFATPPPGDTNAAFLAATWGNGPRSLCWQNGGGFKFTFVNTPDEVRARLTEIGDTDTWIGAHSLRHIPAHGRGDRDDVGMVVAISADLDWGHETRRTADPLPTEAEVRNGLRALGPDLAPSIVVHSGHGLQPWWVLTVAVEGDEAEGLIAQLDAALANVGLTNGRADLASILRLPGTRNHKGEVVPVVVETFSARRFTPEFLRSHWPKAIRSATGGGTHTKHHRGAVTDAQQALCDHVCARYGGHSVDVWRDGSMHLLRPGKTGGGSSASIIVGDDGDALLTVYSDHWPEIGPRPGEVSRSWVLGVDGELHHPGDPFARFTIKLDQPTEAVPAARLDEPPPPPPAPAPSLLPLLTFERLPDPFEVPAPEWHAVALWARPTHGELAGAEKSLKSYTGLALDVGLAAGLAVFGRFEVPEPQRVLLLVGEGGRGPWLRRFAAVCDAYGVLPADLAERVRFTTATASVASVAFMEGVRAELETFGPALVHLDPWYAYAGRKDAPGQVTEVGATLDAVAQLCRDAGASLLINHHYNRGETPNGLRQITGAGHAEWVDSWLLIKHRRPPHPGEGRYQLRLDVGSRQWGGDAYDLDFNVSPITGKVAWHIAVADEGEAEPVADPLADTKLALQRIGRAAHRPMTRQSWVERCPKRRSTALVAFDELMADGIITECGTEQSGTHTVALYQMVEVS